jgi:phosphonate transport system substrate-binding protein
MSDRDSTVLVGLTANRHRIITIWEFFKKCFGDRGLDIGCPIYSNYERMVGGPLAGVVDIAWNPNTAFADAEERLDGQGLIPGMRDADSAYTSVIVARDGDGSPKNLPDLHDRTLAVGSSESGHTAISPLCFLASQGVRMERAFSGQAVTAADRRS